jgi:hemerythrin-like metal-binding protein
MKWQKDYNIGITVVDEQHKKLCSMLTNLENSINSDDVYQVMGDILKELVQYTKYHFEEEEKVMQRISYPDFEKHKKLHKDLVNEISIILLDLKNGKKINAFELKTFLQKWLIDHILGEDKKIGEYFSS